MTNKLKIFAIISAFLFVPALSRAEDALTPEELQAISAATGTHLSADTSGSTAAPAQETQSLSELTRAEPTAEINSFTDPVKYTLGPDDVIEVNTLRHPEFSGVFPVNLEGKIQIKFVGDIVVNGLTKKELEKKITEIISAYVIGPEVNVTILEYKSKVIYILGEVGAPGKFYMRSETIPVREAVVNAGLPTLSAAMRRCRIITPSKTGKAEIKKVDLYTILYGGQLKNNLEMRPGDILYVPSTIMAKVIRVINPISSTIGLATGSPNDINTGKTAMKTLAK